MRKIELEIVALSHTITQSQSYAVVLGEKEGPRRLPIVIGAYEAQAIAVAMERMTPARPLTHDLMRNICKEFSINLMEIIISNLTEGVFYAHLICEHNGDIIEIDSRTSDALALAIRFGCPLYTYEFILDQAGIILEETYKEPEEKSSEPSNTQTKDNGLSTHSLSKLESLLGEAIENEDYERAARLRDEMQRRA